MFRSGKSVPFVNAGRERKSSQKAVEGAVVDVAERPRGVAEVGQVAELEERVAGVRGEPAEEVGPEHRRHHRAVAAARLPGDAAVGRAGQRPVARRRRTGRPRRRGRCGSGRPPASRGTGSRRPTSTRRRRRRARAGSPPARRAGRRAPAPSAGTPTGSATCRAGPCAPGSGRGPGAAAPAPRRRRAARRPGAGGRPGRRADCRAAPRSEARAPRSARRTTATTAPRP